MIDRLIVKWLVPLARWLGERRLERGRARALWAATPILTLPLKASATRSLGLKSTSLVFTTYYITQDFDLNLRYLVNGAARLGPFASAVMDRLVLVWAMLRYDVFHFFFDRGLMRPNSRFGIRLDELDLLKSAGKRVYGFAYGADVRLRTKTLALGHWNFCIECPQPTAFCLCDDDLGQATLDAICDRLTAPVGLGDMLAYPKGVVNLHYWPIDISRLPSSPQPAKCGSPLVIAHAPNHTHFKGSHHLEAIIGKLVAEGHAISYVKIQGVPNSEVIRLFDEADVVADQFLGGAYGYTALEAMAHGKPVISFVRSPELVEAVGECPIINATPDSLEETLRWCLCNRALLAGIGAAGRAYIERWHSVEAVAARLGKLYLDTGNFPAALVRRLETAIAEEAVRRDALAPHAFDHPFRVSVGGCAKLAAAHDHKSASEPIHEKR